MIQKTIRRFKEFDEVTEFRLINAFLTAIGISLLTPVIITLKGLYLAVWVISIFSILSTLSVKTNDFFVKTFGLSSLYKLGIFMHLLLVLSSCVYFYSPMLMIWLDSLMVILVTMVFSAYSILLNNYITHNYPESINDFQVVRNSSWADGFLVGLIVITLITYFLSTSVGVAIFIGFNSMFSLWMIYNWKFFDLRKL